MRRLLTLIAVCLIGLLSLFASQPPFPHVGVVAIAIKDGKILLTKHIDQKGSVSWTPPSCHLKIGETPRECALKEFANETGIVAKRTSNMQWMREIFDPLDSNTITFFVEIKDFDDSKLAENGQWVDLNSLSDRQIALLRQISVDQNAHLS
ncbi:MAG: NUDIX domain-containing protein [Chlamydiia bacterium]|nr:NUDIX domain-containing protein [Chlamydiia bacterium]MCP5492380.1 NUDIX domain-containing protein [Chlamydiales bacterium]